MLHRLSFRLPLGAAAAIVAVIYVIRSAMRGLDFRPDLPTDALVLALFLVVLGIVAFIRRAYGQSDADSDEGTQTPHA